MSRLTVLWWNIDWQSRGRTGAQIDAVRGLDGTPDVIGLCELRRDTFAAWSAALVDDGYVVVDSSHSQSPRKVRVLLAVREGLGPRAVAGRFEGMRDGSVASAEVHVGGVPVEVHAVHIPNGSGNGWTKIDHLWSVRRGLEPHPGRPLQVLCGDFNTPQVERPGEIVTFGQRRDGRRWRSKPTSPKRFTADHPFNAEEWDAGERAVLEGLGAECGMPDVFRRAHPDAIEATWVPRGSSEDRGRRLDHVFASTELDVIACEHIHAWRTAVPPLSDHSAILAEFRV